MFGIEFPELLVILLLALILFGPQRLPEFAQTLAQMVKKFKQASAELQSALPSLSEQTDSPSPHSHYQEQVCPQCHQSLSHDFTFCPACGHRLKEGPGNQQALAS
ncbi:MAG: twin-arginine translocase TatA/TatE family subunit [Deltaproteobacteria bacterium]|nr:twin-arginine translocase TatA/TatE family subunit [Deltaproteobacteria bacterium]MBW1986577.1 twin-arginine translocase TatA/TatE family subunit [Deltaproteobacteria bacterium]MBW2133735.1 twin-arginine translocase TatA/TatE family subunit [Deltaproteobacteria bacterium]